MSKVKEISRQVCVISEQNDLFEIARFENMPVYMGVVEEGEYFYADLVFAVSRSSGCLQLKNLLDENLVYMAAHGSGSVGRAWEDHHSAFADFVIRFCGDGGVVEIGAGHGRLAENCFNGGYVGNWHIFEPNPQCDFPLETTLVKEFFSGSSSMCLKGKTFVHSHFLEHVYEPRRFLKDVRSKLEIGDRMLFSIPNMEAMLARGYLNLMNFEHTYFAAETFLRQILTAEGFEVQKVERFKDDHSLFFLTSAVENPKTKVLVSQDKATVDQNLFLYKRYFDDIRRDIGEVLVGLKNFSGSVYAFSAHIFTHYLIANGVKETDLTGILDNDSQKWGKRLYGTELNVFNPTCIVGLADCIVVTSITGVYRAEIEGQLRKLNPQVKFL